MISKTEYMREWRKNNKEKVKQYQKKYKENNKEKVKQIVHNYYVKHKEEMHQKNKEWKEKNKDRVREMMNKSRNKRAEKLISEGCINPWSVISKGADPKYKDNTLCDDILDLMGSDKK